MSSINVGSRGSVLKFEPIGDFTVITFSDNEICTADNCPAKEYEIPEGAKLLFGYIYYASVKYSPPKDYDDAKNNAMQIDYDVVYIPVAGRKKIYFIGWGTDSMVAVVPIL